MELLIEQNQAEIFTMGVFITAMLVFRAYMKFVVEPKEYKNK